MTVRVINIPNLEKYTFDMIKAEERIAKGMIVTQAKITAPKITGNYANSIEVTAEGAEAGAVYSAKLEYVGRGGNPYGTMRLAGKEVAARNGYKYEE